MARPTQPTPTAPAGKGVHAVRVRYCECDPMGVAHHGAYIPWLEEARTELLRTSGVSYAQLEREGALLAVVKLELVYRRPARYDDRLEIAVRVEGASRVKIHHAYEIRLLERHGLDSAGLAAWRAAGEDLLARATTTLACIGRDGRPRALPEWLAGAGSA
ncbi:MAG: acyl-CoA thioesterase [Phycisphaerales bacterium]|nr:acyl-CoA thioesterase [Phycisphaerales bacterium]